MSWWFVRLHFVLSEAISSVSESHVTRGSQRGVPSFAYIKSSTHNLQMKWGRCLLGHYLTRECSPTVNIRSKLVLNESFSETHLIPHSRRKWHAIACKSIEALTSAK